MAASDYVLLVHGTWTDTPGWHKFDEHRPNNFASRLNKLLAGRGMPDVVEKIINGKSAHFSWSGTNNHSERIKAGRDLAEHIEQICNEDPLARIHIVAHSHGCNVVLKAVEIHLKEVLNTASMIWTRVFNAPLSSDASFRQTLKKALKDDSEEYYQKHTAAFEILSGAFEKFRSSAADDADRARFLLRSDRNEFYRAWLSSDALPRLGRLVFLGPPFLRKFWINRSAWAKNAIKIGDFVFGMGIGLLSIYLVSMLLWTIIWFITFLPTIFSIGSSLRSPDLNFLNWNYWLLGLSGLFAAAFAIIGGMISADASRRINTNLYFDRRGFPDFGAAAENKSSGSDFSLAELSSTFPLRCLTVTAELLDEVMLGFSSEPIVYGALLPQLQNMARPNFSIRLPPVALGHEPGIVENIGRVFYVARRLMFGCFKRVAAPGYRIWQRRLSVGLMRLITSTAFGVPLHEIRKAIVKASNKIEEPDLFDEHVWDVTKHLAQGASIFENTQEREQRYSFLWDTKELAARKDVSKLWLQIKKYETDIAKHYGAYATKYEGNDALSKACVILEERTKEAIGAVGLTHLAYHSDLTICEAVADFIVTGAVPSHPERPLASSLS